MNDAPGVLKQLQASEIFDAALPKRQRVDHAHWAQLSALVNRLPVRNLGLSDRLADVRCPIMLVV